MVPRKGDGDPSDQRANFVEQVEKRLDHSYSEIHQRLAMNHRGSGSRVHLGVSERARTRRRV